MADHCRKQIRDAVASGLVSMLTVQSIHTGRVHPLENDLLPALLIFTNDEAAEEINKEKDTRRNLALVLEGHAQGDGLVDTLDAIANELEPLILGSALPAWVKEISLANTTVEIAGEAVAPAGFIRLAFDILYHVNPAAPDTPL